MTLERNVIDLARIRADGWFENLAEELEEFDQLCDMLGRRFFAFSFIAGVQVLSVEVKGPRPEDSRVIFSVAEGQTQTLPLTDFRERLGTALLNLPLPPDDVPDEPSLEDIRHSLGSRYLLLAPVFGLRLLQFRYGGGPPAVLVELGGMEEELSLGQFRSMLDNAIRSEVTRARPPAPFSIDFKKVPLAEASNRRAAYEETIALLGSWPGPLSMFVRTPQGQALGANERAKLMRGLAALGEAFLRTNQAEWAEDVVRLGIQFGQELEASAPLFALLGQARMEAERYGEAIGLLRRAAGLGGHQPEVLVPLSRCFHERGRHVAAMACLDEAEAMGAHGAEVSGLREEIRVALGDAYDRYRSLM